MHVPYFMSDLVIKSIFIRKHQIKAWRILIFLLELDTEPVKLPDFPDLIKLVFLQVKSLLL